MFEEKKNLECPFYSTIQLAKNNLCCCQSITKKCLPLALGRQVNSRTTCPLNLPNWKKKCVDLHCTCPHGQLVTAFACPIPRSHDVPPPGADPARGAAPARGTALSRVHTLF